MDSQIARGVSKVVERPKAKTVPGPKVIFKRKIGKDGQIEPTRVNPTILLALALMALKDWERRKLNIKMACLEAKVE